MYIKLLHFIISLFDRQNKFKVINFLKTTFKKCINVKSNLERLLNTFIVIDLSKFNFMKNGIDFDYSC